MIICNLTMGTDMIIANGQSWIHEFQDCLLTSSHQNCLFTIKSHNIYKLKIPLPSCHHFLHTTISHLVHK